MIMYCEEAVSSNRKLVRPWKILEAGRGRHSELGEGGCSQNTIAVVLNDF